MGSQTVEQDWEMSTRIHIYTFQVQTTGKYHENTHALEAMLSSQEPFPTSQVPPWAASASVSRNSWSHTLYLIRKSLPRWTLKPSGQGRGLPPSNTSNRTLNTLWFPSDPSLSIKGLLQSYVHSTGQSSLHPNTTGKCYFLPPAWNTHPERREGELGQPHRELAGSGGSFIKTNQPLK